SVTGTQKNDAIWLQGFAEAHDTIGGVYVGVRYGRQEFTDGPNLMVSQRDNNNIRQVENGLRLWARGRTLRADLFDLHMTAYGIDGTGDDLFDNTRRFSGMTLGWVVPRSLLGGSKLYLDPFLWRYRNTLSTWGPNKGNEMRTYAGAHFWGEAGRATIDWTVNHQGGDYEGRAIDAWQLFLAQSFRLGEKPSAPRIGFHADYATGGGAYGSGKLKDAFSPFGNNIYYSYGLFLTPTNMRVLSPNITFQPLRKLRITGEYEWVWRNNAQDAVYRSNGTPYAGTQKVGGHEVGRVMRAQATLSITPRLSFTGRAEEMYAGDVLRRAGYANSTFLAGWLSYRF
ncbi:MAG TPA: alginate export family protein, partial [Novosphingobium sp.]|nr:alginate export family protein [Novosphingobium sp.]